MAVMARTSLWDWTIPSEDEDSSTTVSVLEGLLCTVSVSHVHLIRHRRKVHFEQRPGIVDGELRFHATPSITRYHQRHSKGKMKQRATGTRESLLIQGLYERSVSQPVLSTQSYQHHAAQNKT